MTSQESNKLTGVLMCLPNAASVLCMCVHAWAHACWHSCEGSNY